MNSKDLPAALHRLSEAHKENPCRMCQHFHHWDDGRVFEHTHPKGTVPHGHHGSRYGQTSEMDTPPPKPTGAELIAAERERQMSKEGWTAEHDDEHPPFAMAVAGACYILDLKASTVLCATHRHEDYTINDALDLLWPWDGKWWKPTPNDPIRQLVKAGALIAAEIDKLQRCPFEPHK